MDGRARLLGTGRLSKGLFDAPYSTRAIGFKLAILRTKPSRLLDADLKANIIRRALFDAPLIGFNLTACVIVICEL